MRLCVVTEEVAPDDVVTEGRCMSDAAADAWARPRPASQRGRSRFSVPVSRRRNSPSSAARNDRNEVLARASRLGCDHRADHQAAAEAARARRSPRWGRRVASTADSPIAAEMCRSDCCGRRQRRRGRARRSQRCRPPLPPTPSDGDSARGEFVPDAAERSRRWAEAELLIERQAVLPSRRAAADGRRQGQHLLHEPAAEPAPALPPSTITILIVAQYRGHRASSARCRSRARSYERRQPSLRASAICQSCGGAASRPVRDSRRRGLQMVRRRRPGGRVASEIMAASHFCGKSGPPAAADRLKALWPDDIFRRKSEQSRILCRHGGLSSLHRETFTDTRTHEQLSPQIHYLRLLRHADQFRDGRRGARPLRRRLSPSRDGRSSSRTSRPIGWTRFWATGSPMPTSSSNALERTCKATASPSSREDDADGL